jgi:hypothetical protein
MKNYIGFSRDHSGSMRSIAHAAMRDYNDQLGTIQAAATLQNQDTIVSVVTIGVGQQAVVGREVMNSNVQVLKPLTHYPADAGGTPLIASVFELIEIMSRVPDAANEDVSFLAMITTDGQETQQRHRGPELARKIRELQATDRWTFVFRVPKQGGVRELQRLGLMISGVNVFEWDTTEKGVQVSTKANQEAFTEYFTQRKSGMKRTSRFYANMEDISVDEARKALVDVSSEVAFFPVASSEAGTLIRPFVEKKVREPMVRGGAFYQLVKLEPKVQANKRIAIRDKSTGTVFAGDAARTMLALPTVGTVRLAPDELGEWDVFIQSTSVNRKLDANTSLMYWKGVGKAFQEGPSAR